MRKQLRQVKQFHEAFNALINEKPTIPDSEPKELRVSLIQEELNELYEAFTNEDKVELADALADLLYVTYGTAVSCGLQNHLEDCFDEVHRSNMSKTNPDGGVGYHPNGKIKKPENYEGPDLKNIVLKDPEPISETTTAYQHWPQGEIDNTRELLIRMFCEKHQLGPDEFTFNENVEGERITMTVKAALI